MRTILKRRLDKIETAIMPKPPVSIAILVEPAAEVSAEDRAAFEQGIESALADGQRVVVISSRGSDARIDRRGVEYAGSESEAQMIALAAQPSEQSLANKLADVLAGLSGNVLGVTAAKTEAGGAC